MALSPDINTVVLFPDIKQEETPKSVDSCVVLQACLLVQIHSKMQQKIPLGLSDARHLQARCSFLGLARLGWEDGLRWDWGEPLWVVRGLPEV